MVLGTKFPGSADAASLAGRLKQRRQALGLTQTMLAERLGVSHSAISQMESGKTRRTHKLLELSRELGVLPHWLATGTGPMLAPSAMPLVAGCKGCREQDYSPLISKLERLTPEELRMVCATADAMLAARDGADT